MILNRTKNAITGTVSGLLYKVITVMGSFAIQTIIIRVMGIEYAGLSSLFTSVLSVLSLAELGFGSALVYSMYRPIAEGNILHLNALYNYYKKIYKYVSIAVSVIGFSILPFIKSFVHGTYPNEINLFLLYAIYLINSISGYLPPAYKRSILYAHQRRDVINNFTSLVKVLQYVAQIVILLFFKNYYFYALVFAISTIPVNFLVAWYTGKKYPGITPSGDITAVEKNTIKKKVAALFGHQLGAKIIISSDSIIVSSILGISRLGIYSNYYYIFYSIVEALELVRMSLVAGIGNKIETSNKQENYSIFKVSVYLWMIIVGWASTCLLCMFQDFITLWVGEEFLYGKNMLFIIVAYFYFWQFRTILVVFKDAAGLWREDWYKPYIGVIINILGSVWLTISLKSVAGVLIPTIIIMLFIYFPIESFVVYKQIFKDQSLMKFFLRVITYMIYSLLGMIVAYIALLYVKTESLILNLFVSLLVASFFSVLFFVLFTLKSYEFKWVKQMIARILERRFMKAKK